MAGLHRRLLGAHRHVRAGGAGRGLISQYVSERTLHLIAGIGFTAIGLWTLWK
jgi:putative Ca2+/H+ antiporter (TMEM165/GDT1 family)